jgi:signal transduction histidine kinase
LKILQEDKLDEASSEALSEIQKSLKKIQLLSERFLVLSGHQYPDAAMEVVNDDFDLHKLVNDFIENNREQQTRAQVSYVNNIPEGLSARFDSSLLFEFMQLVVQETLDAALKYVEFTFSGDGCGARFTLEIESDIVLPDDMEDSIFEPFAFPAANVGSGLSFSVARNLITRNGGEVSGSIPHPNKICFTVTFPAALS